MTTYNREKYIREQLDSILNQTYTNFEVVICDDCSKDNTKEILKEYEKKDPSIHVHFNELNLGFKKNFEKAISFCKGEYITFSDQDDVWENFKLQESIEKIGSLPLLCTNSTLTDSDLNPLGYTLKDSLRLKKLPQTNDVLIKKMIHNNCIQGATILCLTDFIKRHLPIPEDIIFHDWYFGIWAAIENNIVYLDTPTMEYRQHSSNVTENHKKSFLQRLMPHKYNRNKVLKESKNYIQLIKVALANTDDPETKQYLTDSIKYYKALPDKKFYTIKYTHKYFRYMQWEYSALEKYAMMAKKFFGTIWFRLFMSWRIKKQPTSENPD